MKYLTIALLSVVLLVSIVFSFTKNKVNLAIILVDWSPEIINNDKNMIPFEDSVSKRFGYKNEKDEIVIPAKFNAAQNFNEYGIADVLTEENGQNWHWNKINSKGEIIVTSFFFDNGPDYYVSGLARFVKRGKVGFIDPKAAVIINADYDWAGSFSLNAPITYVCNGCFEIEAFDDKGHKTEHQEIQGGKWGAIDKSGKIIVPLEYDSVKSSFNDTLQFKKGSKCVNLYWDGNTIFELSDHKCSKK